MNAIGLHPDVDSEDWHVQKPGLDLLKEAAKNHSQKTAIPLRMDFTAMTHLSVHEIAYCTWRT